MRLHLHLERVVAHGARVHIPVRSDAELEFVFILECIPVMLNPRSTLDAWCSSLAGLANSDTTGRALDLVAPTTDIVAVLDRSLRRGVYFGV